MSAPELIEVDTGAPARAVFTTRRGGVSAPPFDQLNLGSDRDDVDAAVRANRRRVCEALGLDPQRRQPGAPGARRARAHPRRAVGAGALHRGAARVARGRRPGDARAWAGPRRCWAPTACPCCCGGATARRSRPPTPAGGASSPACSRPPCGPWAPRAPGRRHRPGDRPLLLPGVGGGPRPVRRGVRRGGRAAAGGGSGRGRAGRAGGRGRGGRRRS